MRRRKVKCKSCGKEGYNVDFFLVQKGNIKIYYCQEEEYLKIQQAKEDKNKCFETIKEIINEPILTPIFIKNLNTINEFYEYRVIEKTFKEVREIIEKSIQNKDFNSEFSKAKYIFTIISNSIGRVYKKDKKEQEDSSRFLNENSTTLPEFDVLEESININKELKSKQSDISMFI